MGGWKREVPCGFHIPTQAQSFPHAMAARRLGLSSLLEQQCHRQGEDMEAEGSSRQQESREHCRWQSCGEPQGRVEAAGHADGFTGGLALRAGGPLHLQGSG